MNDVYLAGGGGVTAFRQSWQVFLRYFRVLMRQPAFLLITIVQPLIWLLLFGALFKAVTQIPGFGGTGNYLDYLTPGIVVMLAVSSAGWTGMGFIEDINSGVMDRMLVTPAWRGAFNLGSRRAMRRVRGAADAADHRPRAAAWARRSRTRAC